MVLFCKSFDCLKGTFVPAKEALEMGMVDAIIENAQVSELLDWHVISFLEMGLKKFNKY